jgi:glycerol-3-phosphate dehydrogenase (NAD(P)+)
MGHDKMTIAIIGAGAWGTTLAYIAAHNNDVILYTRDEQRAAQMKKARRNEKYLPNLELNERISITSNEGDVSKASIVVFAVPSIGFRETIEQFSFLDRQIPYVSVTKGLEQNTQMRMSQVILDADSRRDASDTAVIGGPNLAQEIASGQPAATVVASSSDELAKQLQEIFLTNLFRVYTTDDVVGCEVAGIAKNVVAIAVGVGEARNYGNNAIAAVMTRALAEITRLGVAEGGQRQTFSGLAGIGDLIATCSSPLSRNRTVGMLLGEGKTLDEIRQASHDIAEGVFSAKALYQRAVELNVEMPIVSAVASVIEHGTVSPEAVELLMTRPAGREQ